MLLLRFEILTVTDRSVSQAGWHSITLLSYYHQTIRITSTDIVSSNAGWCLKLWKVFNIVSDISEWYQSWQTVGEEIGIDVITMETQSVSVRMEEYQNKIFILESPLSSEPFLLTYLVVNYLYVYFLLVRSDGGRGREYFSGDFSHLSPSSPLSPPISGRVFTFQTNSQNPGTSWD